MTNHSIDELCEIFSAAGYAHVRIFEQHDKGWFCCIGGTSIADDFLKDRYLDRPWIKREGAKPIVGI